MRNVVITNITYQALVNLITNINNLLPYLFYAIILVSLASLFMIAFVIYEFIRRKP
ncbi:MAG: hypothetical protein ACPLW7_05475 [Minisyncoccia bacterium]|jgi:hypothetical protein